MTGIFLARRHRNLDACTHKFFRVADTFKFFLQPLGVLTQPRATSNFFSVQERALQCLCFISFSYYFLKNPFPATPKQVNHPSLHNSFTLCSCFLITDPLPRFRRWLELMKRIFLFNPTGTDKRAKERNHSIRCATSAPAVKIYCRSLGFNFAWRALRVPSSAAAWNATHSHKQRTLCNRRESLWSGSASVLCRIHASPRTYKRVFSFFVQRISMKKRENGRTLINHLPAVWHKASNESKSKMRMKAVSAKK